jgi:threonylcarbamoyladenosine tRNA methylthiotransferase MtaB
MPTLRTITLGCKVNQYETEYIRQGLARLGYRDALDHERADLCIVNTCTVTVEGEAKSRKLIRQLARQNPGAEIVVMGCYATRAAKDAAALPGVTEVIEDKRQLPQWLAARGLVDVPTGISTFGSRHRAYVKVQDGCQMGCSYCIIPSVRPVLSSRPAEEVLEEIRRLVEHGHREIVLTGIHLGHYGVDAEGGRRDVCTSMGKQGDCPSAWNLERLIRRIAQLDGEFRVRLSSLEAAEVTPELIAAMAEYPDRVCPHLHISMQSGSDTVLARMRRRWPSARFIERCRAAQAALDLPALTTDVIVGFPGETDKEFSDTCRAVEEVGFSKLHVFRFSPRQGTPAAEMPDRVPGGIQQQRAGQLGEIGERLRARYFEDLAGRPLQVLVEALLDGRPDTVVGTSERYAPVELPGGSGLIGKLVRVVAGPVAQGRIRAAAAPSLNSLELGSVSQ